MDALDPFLIAGLVLVFLVGVVALLMLRKQSEGEGERKPEVNIGCGSLIAIAIIVLMFGGRGDRGTEREIRKLTATVEDLKSSIDSQNLQVQELKASIDKLIPPQPDANAPQPKQD